MSREKMTEYTFNQLVDIEQVRQLLQSHHRLSGMTCGVLDADGNVSVAVGWQEVCEQFHRINPVSCERCRASDAYINERLHDFDGEFIEYRCKNGLIDAALPIIISGKHLASFHVGQFFYDDDRPDTAYFRGQAEKLGFDRESYLSALERVPVFSREYVRNNLVFLRNMVNALSETGIKNLELAQQMADSQQLLHELQVLQIELKVQNEELFHARKEMELALNKYTDRYDFAPVSYLTLNHNGTITDVNLAGAILLGGERSKLTGRRFVQFVAAADCPVFTTFIGMVYSSRDKETIEVSLQNEENIQLIVQIEAMADASGQECRLALINITERRHVEQQLLLSNFALDQVREAAFLIDENGHFYYVNQEACRSLGYSSNELLGMAVSDIDAGFSAEDLSQHYNCLLEQGFLIFETRHRARNGHIFPVEITSSLFKYGDSRYVLALVRDITERKRMEDALAEREMEFRTLAENLPDMIIRYDRQCRRVYVNHAFERETGIPIGHAINVPLETQWMPSVPVEEYKARLRQVIETGVAAEMVLEWTRPDSLPSSHDVHVVAEYNPDGQVSGLLAIAHNITRLKKAELRLAKLLAGTSPGVMYTLRMSPDGATCMPHASPRLKDVYGLCPEDVAKDMSEAYAMVHPDDLDRIRESMAAAALVFTHWRDEFRITHPIKGEIWLEGLATPEPEPDGGIMWYGYFHDITERKRIEESLRAKREQLAAMAAELSMAEERERLRIASVLHDHVSQTLLLGQLKLGALAGIPKPEPLGEVIDEVRKLLDQAADEAHSLTVQLNPPILSISGLEHALQWLGKRMESDYGLLVEFSDDQRPKKLRAEPRSVLYQCARELLINVAKHANTNHAWLGVGLEDDMYRLTVEDRGTGFNPNDIVPDFSRDYRFGLFSIRMRIEHMGGKMEIESSRGSGTRITIRLPFRN